MANSNQNQEQLYIETLNRIATSPLKSLQSPPRQLKEDGAEDIYKEASRCP